MKKLLLPLLLVANVCFGQVDLNLGLRAYYPFSGNANDISGNNNNPVFNNATLTADRFGNPNSAYHFNGIDTYMRIPDNPTLKMNDKLSISLWVKPTGWYTGQCYNNMMVIKGDGDNVAGRYSSRFSDVFNGCSATPSTTEERFFDGFGNAATVPILQLNQWYSVVITFDGTTSKIYVNCVLQGTVTITRNFTNAHDLFIGHLNSAQFPYWLNGDLDEVRIYDRTLTIDEVNILGGCITTFACNNWLRTQAVGQRVTVGDLDISGNQMTVEANFNCSSFPINRPDKWQDIVSKHSNTTDANYVLRMDLAGITTTNGHYLTPPPCDNLVLNKTYHVALVYDGSNLKLYRNGFIISQIAATGNLVLNNLLTSIGDYAVNNPVGTNFLGFINEVRIWNIARTQAQLRTYMDASIPNPTLQPGLQGYYTFDNLLNKQGNTAFNGTLLGGATINNTNPNCSFIADSCSVIPPLPGISNIINDYTPVIGFNPCSNTLTVEDGTQYNTGDTVLLIQMKGAVIDSSNTANFGTITDYKNSGNYEFNYVKSRSGNVIELKNMVTRQYDIPAGKVQLVRVPYYTDININGTLTCLPWDGNKGGVLVFNVLNTLTLNANLDVSGRGFKGAPGYNPGNATLNCAQNNYNYPPNTLFAAQKGESITSISNNLICGKGSPAGGGGGGLGHNSGGGGGGNAGGGGFGGYQLEPCGNAPFDNRGIGGKELQYSTATNKIFMGSGGGAGHADNPGNIPPAGGNGGGIIIINADRIRSNSNKIMANGDQGLVCSIPSSANCHDGMGGGGAGGSVLLSINQFLDNATSEVRGGKGADMIGGPIATAGRIGAGGGGGGGLTFVKSFAVPANLTIANAGGLNGVLTQDGNSSWGATSGVAGQNLFNLALPFSLTAFRNNIDSVRIKDSLLICNSYDFKGLAYINTSPITSWQWSFGDGGTANTQNTTHTYITGGTFIVKLVVSDINGCRDSISKTVNAVLFTADAGADTTVCSGSPATVSLRASAGISHAWTPAALLNNPALQNPTATINNTTRFYVTISNAAGCTAQDSVLISLSSAPANTRYPTLVAVPYQQLQLQARNIGGVSFQWLPNAGLDNNTIINPVFFYSQTQEYIVRITTTAGCIVIDTQLVEIKGKKGIYVPKGFTPNGDGNNDRLYPILIGIKQLNYFKIYNRWGNLLFETTSGRPEDGWDGTFKGKKQPVETYTWVVEGIDIDNLIIRKNGNTLLIH